MGEDNLDSFAPVFNVETHMLPSVIEKNEKTIKQKFWKKLSRVASFIPFAHELLSAYYCSIDPATPVRVRAILLAALAYFILPTDIVPDFIVGLGFTDDATVLTAAIGIISGHITDVHNAKAKSILKEMTNKNP